MKIVWTGGGGNRRSVGGEESVLPWRPHGYQRPWRLTALSSQKVRPSLCSAAVCANYSRKARKPCPYCSGSTIFALPEPRAAPRQG